MEQADILADLGCQILQGYALGRPIDAEALAHLMLEERAQRINRPSGLLASEGDQS
jgi:EAL domain-containing protein (putative c-di-GMP-specific phosphodiesterase class I)